MSARCRIGWHRWYTDWAFFNGAYRCNRCFIWRDPDKGARVERERRLWARYDDPGEVAVALARGES